MEIAAGFCPETASLLQRFLISGPDLRITAAPIVAAVWNGPPAAVVAAEMVRVRF